jgi:hypothetical protein
MTGATVRTVIPGITDEALDRAFEPYILESFASSDARWLDRVAHVAGKVSRPPTSRGKGLTGDGIRDVEAVGRHYDKLWSNLSLSDQLHDTRRSWFEWRTRGVQARTIGYKRVVHLYLARAIEWLQPESVVEVGFGWGINLLTLAVQFPQVRFGGIELTEAGVRTAQVLAAGEDTPRLLDGFVLERVRDASALGRLDLRQGRAETLPWPDKSVDMVFTVLALEQMDRIRESVLGELARVARRHVVMIEPFREWNADGPRREFIRRFDYWSGAMADLPAFGLVPIAATIDMPQKLTFRAGMVIAEVNPGRR